MQKRGVLDGRTILRFAHAFESGGGTERYLDDLDHSLLSRHEVRIIRFHLTRITPTPLPRVLQVGRGQLVLVPLPVRPETLSPARSLHLQRLKQRLRDAVLYHPLVWRLWGEKWLSSLRLAVLPGQAIGAGLVASRYMSGGEVHLVMMHFAGGSDAEEVILAARRARVPVGLLNHYSNHRYRSAAMRKHVLLSQGVAGVNGLDVPPYLRSKLVNLSDGIDTSFFQRAKARPVANLPAEPILLLPARIVREKGQLDLVRAVAQLRREGLACAIAFAGRIDPGAFCDELKSVVATEGLERQCRFLGVLDLETLRDWYAASAIMVLPTYHDEGLPRVVLEAQAMALPIVAYSTGGVADGVTDGRTGFLLPTGDLSGLTRRLRELVGNCVLASTMGAAGREASEVRFSLQALSERHERFYHGLLASL